MMIFTGLYPENKVLPHLLFDGLHWEFNLVNLTYNKDCLHCSSIEKSSLEKGDRGNLPCKKGVL